MKHHCQRAFCQMEVDGLTLNGETSSFMEVKDEDIADLCCFERRTN